MYQPVILCIALRYLYGKTINQFNKFIYWVSSISMMLSMMIMVVILSIMNGFERELKHNLLYLTPHIIVTSDKAYERIQNIPDFLLKIFPTHIVYTKPLIVSNVILQSLSQISLGIMFGINPNHFEPLSKYLINNSIDQLVSGKYYIIIGSKLAQQLSVQINDQIRLIIPSVKEITPIGYIPSQRLFTILDIYISNTETDIYQVLVHQDDAAKLMYYPSQCISGWRIWLCDPFYIYKLNQLNVPKNWIIKDWRDYAGPLFQAIKMEKGIMFFLFILIIIVSGFNIISFLVLSITDKKTEVAILKTYGFSRVQIVSIFMIQGSINNIISIILGFGLGIFLSKKFNQILSIFQIIPKTFLFPIEIQYLQLLIIILIICLLIILIVFYPSWRIASIQPAELLHHG